MESEGRVSLRERWIDVLSSGRYDDDDDVHDGNDNDDAGDSRAIRPMSRGGRDHYHYRHEAEMLVDALLGIDDDDDCDCRATRCGPRGDLVRATLKSTMIATSVIATAALLWTVLHSNMARRIVSSVSSSITPYLLPSTESIESTIVAVRGYAIQVQAILHSAPYLLRHLNRIRLPPLLPMLLRLLRKCIILEAWRHIWITVYKLTRYVRRSMTLRNAKLAYHRIVPPWIRRGVRSMFQSVVQAHVAGAVSDLLGSASFEGAIWTSSYTDGDDGGGGGDGIEYVPAIHGGDGIEIVSTVMDSSGDDGVLAIQEALSEFADSAMAGEAAESMVDAGVMEALIVEVGEMS